MLDTILFVFALINSGAILFLIVYFVITLSDFECDYLNAQQCCSKLNFWTMPKFIFHLILVLIFLFTGHFYLFLMNLPFIGYLGFEIYKVPPGNSGVYESTEIYNRDMIKKYLRDCMIYLGFYLIIFFVYLYCLISALLEGDPIRRHEAEEIISEM